ncbi:putative Dihydrofolate reductase [Hypsibius exemplaris]|uniref:dihydrofolate reductase n=1 Tax=Hypsibius exemplaris TaxID=2072580 RepID=A0A1W0WVB8_HYPEX|nr:putative Dihydrofolate reductase [Hypsibius exemplaris]
MSAPRKGCGDPDFRINIIVACDLNRGIGKNGTLPWKLPSETNYYHGMINHLKSSENQNAVIFGRITYESIHDPKDYENLLKVVVSKTSRPQPEDKNLRFVESFLDATGLIWDEKSLRNGGIETIWSLGGTTVYQETLQSPFLHRVYYTEVQSKFDCDTHFPAMDLTKFKIVEDSRVPSGIQSDNGVQYKVTVYESNNFA